MEKILIVDDEDDIRLAIKTLLEVEGYTIFEASSGSQALATLKKQKVDLVISDFFMPSMNGRQLTEAIRKNPPTKNQKIILLTVASFGKEGNKKLKELNIAAYIQKPFDNQALLKKIAQILAK